MKPEYLSEAVQSCYAKTVDTILTEAREAGLDAKEAYKNLVMTEASHMASTLHSIAISSKTPKKTYQGLVDVVKRKLDASVCVFDVINEFVKYREDKNREKTSPSAPTDNTTESRHTDTRPENEKDPSS